jgi:hypothetical protein
VVVFDCLYVRSSGDTAVALRLAKARAGLSMKIIVYKCTTGGNSLDADNRLTVVTKNPGLIALDGIIEQLFYTPAYTALITYRSLEGGIADGLITLSSGSKLEVAYNAMKIIAPPRRTVVSSARTWQHVYGSTPPPPMIGLNTWANDPAHRKVIREFFRQLGSKTRRDSIRQLIWGNELPGWPGGDGEENHDLLLPDFAWEYLPA